MYSRKIEKLRAAVLSDLAEFIPIDFYRYVRPSKELILRETTLAVKLQEERHEKKFTTRQLDAIWLLYRIGMYGGANFTEPEDVAAHLADGITLEDIKETCFAKLQEAISEYALHLSADEARVLLPNHAIKPATETANVLASPLDTFRAMPDLTADELTLAFVGDKDDFSMGVNNSLEIFARDKKVAVPLALLGLVTIKGRTLNAQGAILMQMALKTKLPKDNATSQKITRLKGIFHDYLGIKSDPFYPKNAGWGPRFEIIDKCGAADERARRKAEHHTVSYELLNGKGIQFAGVDEFEVPEDDPGSLFLKEN